MTFDDFVTATADLEAFYEKKLNPTQVRMWFDELKYYTAERYKKTIQKLCKSSQYRPTLSNILETIRAVSELGDAPKESVPCKACGGTGIVLYKKIVEGREYEFASQCNCKNAIGLDYDGSTIADKENRSDYYLAKATDVFHVPEPQFTPTEGEATELEI